MRRAPRRIVRYSRAGVGAHGISTMRNFYRQLKCLANGKIQDVIRTRCTGSYCRALPPERSDYVYSTMTKCGSGGLCCKNFNPSHPPPFVDISRTIMKCYDKFSHSLSSERAPCRIRILNRIEAARNSVSPRS